MNSPRRKLPVAPACESLEGRQLLTAGADLGMGLPMGYGGSVDVSATGGRLDHSSQWGDQGGSMQGTADLAMHGSSRDSGGFSQAGAMGGVGMDSSSSYPDSYSQGGAMGGVGMGGSARLAGGFSRGGSMGVDGYGGPGGLGRGAMSPNMTGGTGASSAAVTQLQTDMEKLRTDSQAIHDKSQVTPAMEAKVRTDINTIKGAENTNADPTALATLQKDQQAAATNVGGPTDAQIAQVQTDQDAVYKSQGVSAGLITQLDTDVAAIKTASGVTDADKATIAADQKAVEADRTALKASWDPTGSTTTTDTPTPTTPAAGGTATTSATPVTTPAGSAASTTTTAAAATTAPTNPPMIPASTTPTNAPMMPVAAHATGIGHEVARHGEVSRASFERRR